MKLALSLALLAGCSFVMTETPRPAPEPPDCSRSYTPVVLDILGALTWPGVVGFAYIAASAEDLDLDDDDAATAGLLIAGTFIAEVISAGVGISRVGDCKRAHRRYYSTPRYPYPYPPQPYYPPPPPPPAPPSGATP